MKTELEILKDRIDTAVRLVQVGEIKDGQHIMIDYVKFAGADIEYYNGERQLYRYGLYAHVYNGKAQEIVIGSMPMIDGSWGAGTYFDINPKNSTHNDINRVLTEYLELRNKYNDKAELANSKTLPISLN